MACPLVHGGGRVSDERWLIVVLIAWSLCLTYRVWRLDRSFRALCVDIFKLCRLLRGE